MANVLAVGGPNYRQRGAPPAGFLAGLWHGLIRPITFLVSLFNPGVDIYETSNNGGWYNFGFVWGVSASFGGSGSQAPGRIHLKW